MLPPARVGKAFYIAKEKGCASSATQAAAGTGNGDAPAPGPNGGDGRAEAEAAGAVPVPPVVVLEPLAYRRESRLEIIAQSPGSMASGGGATGAAAAGGTGDDGVAVADGGDVGDDMAGAGGAGELAAAVEAAVRRDWAAVERYVVGRLLLPPPQPPQ